ncbi:hypothetical protein RND81_01G090700, partial [Saponaria officinalis]
WVRRVELQFIPTIGQVFSSLEEGIEFYRIYALACGFTPRKYTMKTHRGVFLRTKLLFVIASNGDIDNNSGIDSIKSARRRVKITRIGCQAHIRFASQDNVIVVDQFYEKHNHRLFSVHDRDLQKLSRSLSLFHKQLIIDHSKLNIGPSKSFTIFKEYVNGYSNVGASLIEFKNFQRDIKCYIGERDAQLFIDRFKKLSETKKGFTLLTMLTPQRPYVGFFGLMLKLLEIILVLGMQLVLIQLTAQTNIVWFSPHLPGLILINDLFFSVLLYCQMKMMNLLNGLLRIS